jgi:hypothetical protein
MNSFDFNSLYILALVLQESDCSFRGAVVVEINKCPYTFDISKQIDFLIHIGVVCCLIVREEVVTISSQKNGKSSVAKLIVAMRVIHTQSGHEMPILSFQYCYRMPG